MRKYKTKRKFKKRKRRSVFKRRFFGDFILFFIFALFLFYFLFLSEVLKIREIEIFSAQSISQKEIRAFLEKELKTPFLYFFSKDTFFLVSSQKIEEKILKEHPEIEKVNLKKNFPKDLIVEIKERIPKGIFCFSTDNCFLIDNQGIIFKAVEKIRPENLPIIFGPVTTQYERVLGEEVIYQEKINQILEIENEFQKLEIEPEKFILKDNERLDIKITEGWEIYFDLREDINLALTKLKLLLEKEISLEKRKNLEYIDLRFSKVFYK
ncbi:MAG: FtsQ-type POTRA domain-containing protein [Patescibacteria group bacterium]|nr:FtsQ-type POTRA domain-containing protein [Patescibacteria group bacterium]